jgi:hypothetical protein
MEISYSNWTDAIKNGIKNASSQYIAKNKWYHISILSVLKYKSIVQKNSYLNTLVNLIDERCKKLNINLKEVSNKDFNKLAEATRFIFLKQDFKNQTDFKTLSQSITDGKLDNDFNKYYYPFKYTKNIKTNSYELFRKSIDNNIKKKYNKSFNYTKELEGLQHKKYDKLRTHKHRSHKHRSHKHGTHKHRSHKHRTHKHRSHKHRTHKHRSHKHGTHKHRSHKHGTHKHINIIDNNNMI